MNEHACTWMSILSSSFISKSVKMAQNMGSSQAVTEPSLMTIYNMGYYTAIHEIWSRLGDSYSEYENFEHWTDDQVQESCQENYNSVLHHLQPQACIPCGDSVLPMKPSTHFSSGIFSRQDTGQASANQATDGMQALREWVLPSRTLTFGTFREIYYPSMLWQLW